MDEADSCERAVVFFDEIDSLGGARSSDAHEMSNKLITQFLALLDGFDEKPSRALIVGATNRPGSLDPTLMRSGRFDRRIDFGLPSTEARRAILTATRPLSVERAVNLEHLAALTKEWCSADLRALWTQAFQFAHAEGRTIILELDCEVAIERISPGVRERRAERGGPVKWFKRKSADPMPNSEEGALRANSLREFVYLDEVSVYSLTSSPDQPPPVSVSESSSQSAGEVLAGQIDAGAQMLLKTSLKGELNSARSSGLQMQRQFNIQSQFARLHQSHQQSFALVARPFAGTAKSTSDLADALTALETQQLAVPATRLTRGVLTEIPVALRAHSAFDITAFTRALGSLITNHPELLNIPDLLPSDRVWRWESS